MDGRFRKISELQNCEKNCPIEKLKNKLLNEGIADEENLLVIENKIAREIDEAFLYARKSSCPDPSQLFDGLWGLLDALEKYE